MVSFGGRAKTFRKPSGSGLMTGAIFDLANLVSLCILISRDRDQTKCVQLLAE